MNETKVYLAMFSVAYEGETVLGIYKTPKSAVLACHKHLKDYCLVSQRMQKRCQSNLDDCMSLLENEPDKWEMAVNALHQNLSDSYQVCEMVVED